MIELQTLSRRYGDVLAVDDISCHIGQGEVVGLLGHNGAGKTTVMKMLTGFLDASAGSIVIDGQSMTNARHSIQREIGYLPENCPVYDDMMVAEYLLFRAELMGVPEAEQPAAIRDTLARTGLTDRALEPIATLSRGLRQRVGVAQAILHQPSIVILDEPTNGLDPDQIQQMRHLIRQLAEHATVIVSTHILSEVEAVCERVLMLSKGRLVLDERLAELNRDASLMLETDEADEHLIDAVSEVAGVIKVTRPGEGRLRLHTRGNWQAPAARLAELIHEMRYPLYRLTPEVRSLETIFRDVNEQVHDEVAHA